MVSLSPFPGSPKWLTKAGLVYGLIVRAPAPQTWWLPQCPSFPTTRQVSALPPLGASRAYASSPGWLAYLWHNPVLTVMPTVVACGHLGGQRLGQPPTRDLGVPQWRHAAGLKPQSSGSKPWDCPGSDSFPTQVELGRPGAVTVGPGAGGRAGCWLSRAAGHGDRPPLPPFSSHL